MKYICSGVLKKTCMEIPDELCKRHMIPHEIIKENFPDGCSIDKGYNCMCVPVSFEYYIKEIIKEEENKK